MSRSTRAGLGLGLAGALAVVGVLTLLPSGYGWSWGSPVEELRWYLTGLESSATMLQLVGNLSLLVVPAALAVLLWPSLARASRLPWVALAAGTTIEVLQWALPLGRVVSPLDALLNAVGAIGAAVLVAVAADRLVLEEKPLVR
jgi:VanZ like family